MSSSATTTSPLALDNTLGALLVGVLLATALWGISTSQTYEYYSVYAQEDPKWILIMVATVYIVDTIHEFMLCHLIYRYSVSGFGDYVYMGEVIWSILVMVLLSTIVAFIVQTFLIYRVWILSKKNVFVTGSIFLLVVGEVVVGIVYFVQAWSKKSYGEISSDLNVMSRLINAFGAAGDVAITVALIWLLRQSRSGIRRTDAIVTKLITFCLTTGLATSVDAILSLISISAWPSTFIYITFYMVIARLYTNSLMATLNARQKLKAFNAGNSGSHSIVRVYRGPTGPPDNAREHPISIKREVETEIHQDGYGDEDFEMDPRVKARAV
ncbi:hypothetical protein D9758_004327 [Tetrapyrgos nigripes]|uniref:DUF6534 domain-containing protein n=1 Tax=Tetrapyrgos nigripes TaxID=182062 RepID=A0A8H5GMT4_9AGAR|nr:hypothetical protein D9758_004327 [Tetrapyrgos nigripes]